MDHRITGEGFLMLFRARDRDLTGSQDHRVLRIGTEMSLDHRVTGEGSHRVLRDRGGDLTGSRDHRKGICPRGLQGQGQRSPDHRREIPQELKGRRTWPWPVGTCQVVRVLTCYYSIRS